MILATKSGWLIAVEKVLETKHTITVKERGEPEPPYKISKKDPDQKLFGSVDEAIVWIKNHPWRPAMTTNKPQIEAYLVTRIKGQGYGKPRKILDAEVYDATSDSFFVKGAKENYTVEPLVPLSGYEALQAELETVKKVAYGNIELLERNEALLSDHERLQAELESLKEYAELGKAVQQKREPGKRYGCHCDLDEGMEPDECVIDEGSPHQCIYAKRISAKEQCEYWRVITSDANQEH